MAQSWIFVLFALKDIPVKSEMLYDYGIPTSFNFPRPCHVNVSSILQMRKRSEGPPIAFTEDVISKNKNPPKQPHIDMDSIEIATDT